MDGPDNEPLVTFPDGDTPSEELQLDLSTGTGGGGGGGGVVCVPMSGGGGGGGDELSLTNGQLCSTDTVKFEEKRMTSASKTKVITDGFSSEQVRATLLYNFLSIIFKFLFSLRAWWQATSNSAEMKRLQTGDIDYKEETAAAAMRNKIEVDGIMAEQNAASIKVCLCVFLSAPQK